MTTSKVQPFKGCSCRACRNGRCKGFRKRFIRRFRHQTRHLLKQVKQGRDVEIPVVIGTGYSD